MPARRVSIIPHTHWDREWYLPYQSFRFKLVGLLDDLLPLLEADPGYAHFQLDGQMAVVDDYLEVRPEAEDVLRRLATSGRLSMGPWYTLPDEFLVSGETHIRNLQMGLARAASFGGAMEVGYLPDTFGHIAQMPQIVAQFGFADAVVWRGVPSVIDADAFWWQAPDGTAVRAEYLLQGYGNGAHLPDDAKELVARIERFEDEYAGKVSEPVLWMNGTDHLLPQPWLGRIVTEVNGLQDDYELEVTSLPRYLAAASREDLPTWTGELRSGARANLLMGVTSNRVDVRQAAAAAERDLERCAEPLAALFLPAERWPGRLLDLAWREVVRNAAHDSVCACSHDEVCDAVLHRYHEASRIAEAIADQATHAAGDALAHAGAVVVNPSPRTRAGVVALTLPDDGDLDPALQLLSLDGDIPFPPLSLRDCALLAGEALRFSEIDSVDIDADTGADTGADGGADGGADHPIELRLYTEGTGPGALTVAQAETRIAELLAERPDALTAARFVRPSRRRVLARVAGIPGFGWRRWDAGALTVAPVTAEERVLDNGLVRVEVANDGTFSVNGHTGFDRLVDGGDVGDTYNWCPPDQERIVDTPDAVEVAVTEPGPLRARLVVTRHYTWPAQAGFGQRLGEREVEVRTTVELHAGSELVRVTTELDNQSRDHRLRTLFPLPTPAASSHAECAFTVVERGLVAEGGPSETALATYPSRRFVQAGGLTVVHEGLLEYELIDLAGEGDEQRAATLALTLLRATGMLSQIPMATRPLPAGPFDQLDGAQVFGRHRFVYGVAVGDHDPYALVDELSLPLGVVSAAGGGTAADTGSALEVHGAEVSAVRREAGGLLVRVFNPTGTATTVELPGRHGWLVDLRGRPREPFEGSFPLRPHGIATAVLAEPPR
jgi:hypothetical protein